ncbi:MAG: hypothetical protein NTV73_16655 [Hyphomicrobiales bacterium]|nr:hypothetical protein [Hyphomicrobiales bacterium]
MLYTEMSGNATGMCRRDWDRWVSSGLSDTPWVVYAAFQPNSPAIGQAE